MLCILAAPTTRGCEGGVGGTPSRTSTDRWLVNCDIPVRREWMDGWMDGCMDGWMDMLDDVI